MINLEEIKKRAEEITKQYKFGVLRMEPTPFEKSANWAADQILALVAEVERLKTGLGVAGQFIDRNDKLTAANKIMRDRINSAMEFDSHYPMKDLLNAGLAEADEVKK